MNPSITYPIPKLENLPVSFPADGALSIVIQDGVPIIKASSYIQKRIENLLSKEEDFGLSQNEIEEFNNYEQIDDYLSLLNRINRNLFLEKDRNILYVLTQKNIF